MIQWHGKSLRPMSKVPSTTENLKYRGVLSARILYLIQLKKFSFEKYFQVHVKTHEIHAAALFPVPE